jgi:mRNA interferase MazF
MNRGKIVLTPFPFTDLSGYKLRPALVVSRSDRAGSDVIIAFIGRHGGLGVGRHELLIEDSHTDFRTTGLKVSSVVKLDKLTTVQATVLIGEIGELSPRLLAEAEKKLRNALGL